MKMYKIFGVLLMFIGLFSLAFADLADGTAYYGYSDDCDLSDESGNGNTATNVSASCTLDGFIESSYQYAEDGYLDSNAQLIPSTGDFTYSAYDLFFLYLWVSSIAASIALM